MATPHTITDQERRELLDQEIRGAVTHGWRVESQTGYTMVVVRGHRPRHLLHLILSVVTLGLWLPVWLLVAVAGGERRKVVSVDERGIVHR